MSASAPIVVENPFCATISPQCRNPSGFFDWKTGGKPVPPSLSGFENQGRGLDDLLKLKSQNFFCGICRLTADLTIYLKNLSFRGRV